MPTRNHLRNTPQYRTVAAMAEAEVQIRVLCDGGCHLCHDVDLVALAGRVGADYCLIGRRSRCRRPGCAGWNRFYYLCGVYRPLWSDDDLDRWSRQDRARRP